MEICGISMEISEIDKWSISLVQSCFFHVLMEYEWDLMALYHIENLMSVYTSYLYMYTNIINMG